MDTVGAPDPPGIRAYLLGHTRIFVGDRQIPDDAWPRRSVRSLLLLLLLSPANRLHRDQVIDLLWPTASPKSALNALYVALHGLRRALEPDLRTGRNSAYVEFAGDVVRVRPGAIDWIDVDVFMAQLDRAHTANHPEHLGEALTLYVGDLLADEPYVDWPIARRQQLRSAWRNASLTYAQLECTAGQYMHAIPAIQRVLASDPTDEPAVRALMSALAAAGRREDALAQYNQCRLALINDLGVMPSAETNALLAAIASTPLSLCAGIGRMPTTVRDYDRFDNLPSAPNPLVGRIRELEAVQDLLSNTNVRLVTITGPGGIGKTRLALEAANQLADDFAGGVGYVALAAIRDPALLLPTIARTLAIEEVAGRSVADSLREALRNRDLLLVLDNMEQLVAAGTDVADLTASFPRLKILVTSREPLHILAEHLFSLPTMATPLVDSDSHLRRITPGAAQRFEAVALFSARARAVETSFAITDENVGAVAAICQRLDGLPLAIELAAARSRHVTPSQLQNLLTKRLPLLTGGARDLPPRQRTMRDTIAWSYDLLDRHEQALFRRLSVFNGGFSLDAVSAVGQGLSALDPGISLPTASLDVVASLVDKSLIQRNENDEGRFGMLETIREYGLDLLLANGEVEDTCLTHATFFTTLAEATAPLLHGNDQSHWLDRLEADHDNFRAALSWSCDQNDGETALRLSVALAEFWKTHGHLREGRAWLDRALRLVGGAPSSSRAHALEKAANLDRKLGDNESAVERLSRSLCDWESLGDRGGVGTTLGSMAAVAAERGDYAQAINLNERALSIFEGIEDRLGLAETLNRMGIVMMDQGKHAQATDLYNRSLSLFRDLGNRHGEARALNNLGTTAFWRTDYREAVILHEKSLALWQAAGDRLHAAIVLANLGEDLRADGDLERAIAVAAQGCQLSRAAGDKRATATALFIMGSLHQHERVDPRAVVPLVEGLLLFQHIGDRLGIAWCLEALAGPATAAGQPELAARLCGASALLREAVSVPLQPAERPAHDRHVDAARAALGDEALDHFRSIGRVTPIDTIVAEAAGLADEAWSSAQEPDPDSLVSSPRSSRKH